MRHHASREFWAAYEGLPERIRDLADKNFALLKADPRHPSLHFKRVGRSHRALGLPIDEGILWFWIGLHGDYDRLVR